MTVPTIFPPPGPCARHPDRPGSLTLGSPYTGWSGESACEECIGEALHEWRQVSRIRWRWPR